MLGAAVDEEPPWVGSLPATAAIRTTAAKPATVIKTKLRFGLHAFLAPTADSELYAISAARSLALLP